jgi:hypothetical protein
MQILIVPDSRLLRIERSALYMCPENMRIRILASVHHTLLRYVAPVVSTDSISVQFPHGKELSLWLLIE